jgi:hypothetical protein
VVRERVELDRGEGIPIENIEKELLPGLDVKTGNIDHFAWKRYVLVMPAVEFTADPDEKPVAGAAREEDGKTYECDAAADRRGWEIVLRARQ